MLNSLVGSTKREIARMESDGMKKLSLQDCKSYLNDLGYEISESDSFVYTNTGNELTYYARSIYIIDKTSKKSFANTETNNENLPKLQAFRRNYFCVVAGRIYEF